jgi:hypothetical protein
MVHCLYVEVAFNEISTYSGLRAGDLLPIVQMGSRVLTGSTHALDSSPAVTVTLGKVHLSH